MLDPPVPHVPLSTLQVGRAAQLDLALSFSAETLAGASKLSLSPAQLEANEGAHEYLSCCCVWHARFPGQPLTESDKHMQGCTCGHVCPPSIPAALQESLDLLIVHPFTNSGGARYLPRFAAERVLVEEFPEQHADSAPSALLSGLGLSQRCGLSRLEIEHALLHHGPRIVHDELQLDPHAFRLLCIPFDVYSRLGPVQGWGQLPQWTHFDGYQLLKGGKLRALVGGHVRLGGVYDLCSISRTHERVGTIARFAVVRRERFIAV